VPGERTREVTLDLEPLPAPRAASKGQARRPALPQGRGAPDDPVTGTTDDPQH